jgi:hypothetical protein
MPSATPSLTEHQSRQIEYLSPPAPVRMADRWFEIATTDHFWVRRRFEVLRRLDDGVIPAAAQIAEIGCGHGLLQRQVEDHYGKEVTGFDLNEYALKRNLSNRSRLCCYDIRQQLPALHRSFDLIFLFDVLEHLSDETQFLNAVLYHLAPRGNSSSTYPPASGHFRCMTGPQGTSADIPLQNCARLRTGAICKYRVGPIGVSHWFRLLPFASSG